jgi:hypothetical protein
MQNKLVPIFVILVALVIVVRLSIQKNPEYNSRVNPADFTIKITNPYFSLPIGKKLIYEEVGGSERIEITIEGDTKKIMGVETLIYHDQVFQNGQLVEDTRDYLAQDKEGNVWYFGENVDNYIDGKMKDHSGAWIAGVDGAQPGIWIKADHKVGDSYRQEYYRGKAEDRRDVVAVNLQVVTRRATYENCVKFYDWTPLDPGSREHKYYCPGVASEVLIEDLDGGNRTELVEVITP